MTTGIVLQTNYIEVLITFLVGCNKILKHILKIYWTKKTFSLFLSVAQWQLVLITCVRFKPNLIFNYFELSLFEYPLLIAKCYCQCIVILYLGMMCFFPFCHCFAQQISNISSRSSFVWNSPFWKAAEEEELGQGASALLKSITVVSVWGWPGTDNKAMGRGKMTVRTF